MRNIKNKIVYGKTGEEADIWFLKGAIESSLEQEKQNKAEIHQLWKEIYKLSRERKWKEIYKLRKRIEKELKPALKKGEEYRQSLEKKIEEIREKQKTKNSG